MPLDSIKVNCPVFTEISLEDKLNLESLCQSEDFISLRCLANTDYPVTNRSGNPCCISVTCPTDSHSLTTGDSSSSVSFFYLTNSSRDAGTDNCPSFVCLISKTYGDGLDNCSSLCSISIAGPTQDVYPRDRDCPRNVSFINQTNSYSLDTCECLCAINFNTSSSIGSKTRCTVNFSSPIDSDNQGSDICDDLSRI